MAAEPVLDALSFFLAGRGFDLDAGQDAAIVRTFPRLSVLGALPRDKLIVLFAMVADEVASQDGRSPGERRPLVAAEVVEAARRLSFRFSQRDFAPMDAQTADAVHDSCPWC